MTDAQRKHLLIVACTVDRLQLALLQKRKRQPGGSPIARLIAKPWFDVAAGAIIPLLPRRLRLMVTIARTWQSHLGG